MSPQPEARCVAADGKEPIINAGFGYPLMVSAVAFNRQHSRIASDEALMRQALGLIDDVFNGEWNGDHDRDAIAAALRARLETSK